MANATDTLVAPKKRKPTNIFKSENPHQPEKPKRKKRSERRKATENGIKALNPNWGYAFVAPFFVMFLIFGLAPVIYSVWIAFYNWDPLGDEQQFWGLTNFTDLIVDDQFWIALRNTFSIWFFSTIPQMIMAIGLASILRNPKLKGATFWRTILLVPNITSVLAIAIVFG